MIRRVQLDMKRKSTEQTTANATSSGSTPRVSAVLVAKRDEFGLDPAGQPASRRQTPQRVNPLLVPPLLPDL